MQLHVWAVSLFTMAALIAGCTAGNEGSGGTGGTGGAGGGAGGPTTSGEVTWTLLYNTVFGPNGTSNCAANGACHTNIQNGFKCGKTKASCYDGLVAAGLVVPGPDAGTSQLVESGKSPLCGSLGGNMPKVGKCITAAQLDKIEAWLAEGAQDN